MAIGACLLSVFIYGMNLYSVIQQTVSLQKIEKDIVALKSSVQDLDTKYISLSSSITSEMAKNFGLHEAPVTAYINRTVSLGRVAILIPEI